MTPETQQQLLQRLDVLAAKLGTTASHLWDVLVRQARVEAFCNVLWVVVLLLLSVALAYFTWRFGRWLKSEEDGEALFPALIFSGGGSLLCAGLAATWAIDAVKLILNPEFYALQQVLNVLK